MDITLSDLMNAIYRAGVRLTITPHNTVRLEGNPPSTDLRSHIVAMKGDILDALRLTDRLDRGWTLCEQATGTERDRLEDHWIDLLHQYERLMDQPLNAVEGRAA